MYRYFMVSLWVFLIAAGLTAAPRITDLADKYQSKKIAYTIEFPSRTIDGKFFPAKSMNVERLPDENLYPNLIEIKTKDFQYIDENSVKFSNHSLQSAVEYLGIKSIRAPYTVYFKGDKLLSADKFGVSRIYEIRFQGNHNPYDVCKLLMENPEIEYATPVFKRSIHAFNPDDAWYNLQYHLKSINMPDAWEITKGDTNIVIADVDSGTDILHEDLKGNIWTNPGEIPNNGKDDDGNGKIDDVNGWDLIGNITVQQYSNGQFKENNNPINTLNTHGTHTAGCASAVTNNGKGVAAPGFNIRILPVKCSPGSFQSSGITRGYEGILYAAVTGADVINCSWGGPGWSPVEEDIINQAISLGALIVASSGNSAKNLDINKDYPASFKGVMSVGSSGNTDRPSNFSSYGNLVSVFAPGENIWSTLPGNKYAAQSGTSMSSPVAAGVAALLLSIHKDWTPEHVIHQLRGTSDNVLMLANPEFRHLFIGRLNAAKALQFNNQPGKSMPGIGLEFMSVGTNNVINSFDMTDVKITLKNYLAADDKVKVRIIAIDDFIEFDNYLINIGNFGSMETKEITAKARLRSNNPWFKGDAEVLFEITGSNYINYELGRININIPSSNKMFSYADVPEAGIVWHGSAFLGDNTIYVVGVSPYPQIASIFVKSSGTIRSMVQINAEPVYCIYPFDEQNLIAGDGPLTGSALKAQLHYTTNGGQTWTRKPIDNITPFVNSLNFFNKNDGILLGDPKGSAWGVAVTSDGGSTWQALSNLPPPNASETGLVGSVFQKNDTVWFGTTAGRIFKTTDRGSSWTVQTAFTGGVVSSVAFSDSVGACLYGQSNAQGAPRFLATTTNGGKTWKSAAYNFTANNQIPLTVYAINDSKAIVVQLLSGQVIASDNLGLSWYPVLSEKKSNYSFAVANQTGSKVRMFAAGGNELTKLEFNYSPAEIKKEIAFVGSNLLEFDTIFVNTNKMLSKEVKNLGNQPATINSIDFIPDNITDANDFVLLSSLPQTTELGSNLSLRFRFQPSTYGLKSGSFILSTDGNPQIITLHVTGFVPDPASVSDNLKSDLITLSPNPASNLITVGFDDVTEIRNVTIFDLKGNEMLKSGSLDQNGAVDVSALASGVYLIKFDTNSGIITKSVIIKK